MSISGYSAIVDMITLVVLSSEFRPVACSFVLLQSPEREDLIQQVGIGIIDQCTGKTRSEAEA